MKFLAVLLFILLALYGGYKLLFPSYPTYAWHQKMTVEVETPDGIKVGSSVTSVLWDENGNWMMGWGFKLKGEAVVVDLGGGKFLFSLLASPLPRGRATSISLIAPAAFSKLEKSLPRHKKRSLALNTELLGEVAGKRGRANSMIEIPEHLYPLLVTFDSIDTPASVKKVESYDLEKHFGAGVRLKRITLEVTDEPVTKGKVGKILTWLSGHKGRLRPYSGPSRHLADVPIADLLDKRDFRRKF